MLAQGDLKVGQSSGTWREVGWGPRGGSGPTVPGPGVTVWPERRRQAQLPAAGSSLSPSQAPRSSAEGLFKWTTRFGAPE